MSGPLLGVFAVATITLLVAFSTFFSFARKHHITGHLVAIGGAARVTALSSGVVRRRFVSAGDVVAVGDVLYWLSPSEGLADGATAGDKLLDVVEKRRHILLSRLEVSDA